VTTTTEQAQVLSDQLGVPVRVIQEPQWDQLMQAGVVIKLHISRWRAEKRRSLSDMGVTLDDADVEKAWSDFLDPSDLGAMKLLPVPTVRALNSKENAARAALRAASINTHWGFFLPVARFSEWLETDKKRQADYLKLRDEIVAQYDEIREHARLAYLDAAKGVYWEENKLPAGSDVPWEFREEYADKHMASFISRTALAESITYDREIGFLPIPTLLAQEQAERARILSEANLTREQRLLLESLNKEFAQDAYAAKKSMILDFFADVRKELADRITEVCRDVEAAIMKNNRLPPKNLTQIKNLVETISSLNVLDDEAIKDVIIRLGFSINGKTADAVDVPTLLRTIRGVNLVAKETLENLTAGMRDPRAELRDLSFEPVELVSPPSRIGGRDLDPSDLVLASNGRAPRNF
jgi:hypothetical protein